MIAFRLAFFATAALAAPAAEAEADPQLLLGGLGYAHHGYGLAYHHVAVPVCKTVPKTVVIGQRCHVEPNCATEDVVVGQHVTGHEEPVCTDHEVVAHGGYHAYGKRQVAYGKREAEADAQYLLGHGLGHAVVAPALVKHTVKSCVPGAPIIEDVTAPLTKCAPAQVCEDVTAEVPEVVCGEPAAAEEAVEEA